MEIEEAKKALKEHLQEMIMPDPCIEVAINLVVEEFEKIDAMRKAIAEIEAKFDEALKEAVHSSEKGMIRNNGMATAYADAIVIIGKHFPSLAQQWDKPKQD